MADYSLENDLFRLLREEPFFAAMSRHVNKHATKSIPTAGVKITDDGFFDMAYNPDFFEGLTERERRGVLKHEFYHLIFEHCLTRNPDGKRVSKIWNWGTDLAINCHLKGELPEMGLFPEKFGFEDYLTAEQYVQLLEEKYPPPDDGGGEAGDGLPQGMDNLDDHEGWGGDPNAETNESSAIARERLREAMKKGVEEAAKQSNGFGNMHQSIRDAIIRFVNGSIDWRAVLRNFISQSQRANKSNTIKRINKRFPYIHPGRKTNRTANIAIAIDQSGSVSDELLGLFFAELENLSKVVTFDIIPFDTEVGEKLITTWKKGQSYPAPQRVMNGGTCFNAPTEYVNKVGKYDGLIVLTDMQAPAPVPCKVRRLWITDEDGKNNPYFTTNEIVVAARKMRH